MDTVNHDIIELIIHKLEIKDILSLAATCRKLRDVITNFNWYWYRQYLLKSGGWKHVAECSEDCVMKSIEWTGVTEYFLPLDRMYLALQFYSVYIKQYPIRHREGSVKNLNGFPQSGLYLYFPDRSNVIQIATRQRMEQLCTNHLHWSADSLPYDNKKFYFELVRDLLIQKKMDHYQARYDFLYRNLIMAEKRENHNAVNRIREQLNSLNEILKYWGVFYKK